MHLPAKVSSSPEDALRLYPIPHWDSTNRGQRISHDGASMAVGSLNKVHTTLMSLHWYFAPALALALAGSSGPEDRQEKTKILEMRAAAHVPSRHWASRLAVAGPGSLGWPRLRSRPVPRSDGLGEVWVDGGWAAMR